MRANAVLGYPYNMPAPHVQIESITRRFGDTVAVDALSLSVQQGELLGILGHSGSGKSTLLHMIAGHLRPDGGSIRIGDKLVAGPDTCVPPEKRDVGVVFQDYALFPHLTVTENVGFGLRRARNRMQRVATMLDLIGMQQFSHRYPHELSGGQQQRVAVARALAREPQLLLLDEPFSNLDSTLREQVRAELVEVLRATGVTCIFVTHDQEEALGSSDRVAVMDHGRILQVDDPETLYRNPATHEVAEFVGKVNVLPGMVRDGMAETEIGRFWLTGTAEGEQDVYVRPELLELRPDTDGCATVVGREFRGHDVFYTLRLDSGRTVFAHRPSVTTANVGDRVAIDPQLGQAVCLGLGCAQTDCSAAISLEARAAGRAITSK